MMDLTTRLGLQKPDPDPVTGDFLDVQILNENADAIDDVISFTVCTSTTRPPSPFAGQAILETNTGDSYVWGGSSWLPLLAGLTHELNQLGIGIVPDTPNPLRKLTVWSSGSNNATSQVLFRQSGSAAGSRALSTRGGGDTGDRFSIDFDGKMQWYPAPGGTTDVTLFRSGVDELTATSALVVQGDITWGSNPARAVYAINTGQGTTTSTTYGLPTAQTVGLVFVAPPTGRVKISWSSETMHSVANGWAHLSPNVRTGGTIGSGTVILPASDTYSTRCRSATGGSGDKTMTNFYLLTALTAGSSYNVQLYARVNTAGTGNYEMQTIMVEPML